MSGSAGGAQAGSLQAQGEIDLGLLRAAIARHRRWIILPTLIVCGLAIAFVNLVSVRYTADARIILQPPETYYTKPNGASETAQSIDERDVTSNAQLVASRDVARRVVARLGIENDPALIGRSGLMSWLQGLFGGASSAPIDPVDAFMERTLVFPVGVSRNLQIEFTAPDPQLAANAANALAEVYIAVQEEAKQEAARSAGGWLINTIEPLRLKVAEAEAKVEAYRARTGLLISTNNNTIQQQQLGDMNAQLATAKAAQLDAEAKARLLRDAISSGRPLEISEIASNELVRKLAADRATVKAQLALESRSLLPGHPRIKELSAQLADIDTQLRLAGDKAVRTLENDAKIASARVESLRAALDRTKQQSADANESEVELRALEREARSQREQLEAMTTRYRDAIARDAKNSVAVAARIFSRADVPKIPSFPKKIPIVLIAGLSTLLLSLMAVVTHELLSSGAVMGGPAQQQAEQSPRGFAPAMPIADANPPDRSAPIPAVWQPHRVELDRIGECLARLDPGGRGLTCAVTADDGPVLGESLVLGRLLAKRARTILVDATDEAQGMASQPGLAQVLNGEASFAEVIFRDKGSTLHRIATGRIAGALPADWPDALTSLVCALEQTYERVLIAGSNPESNPVTAMVLARCDGAVIVAGSQGNSAATLLAAKNVRLGSAAVFVIEPLRRAVAADAA